MPGTPHISPDRRDPWSDQHDDNRPNVADNDSPTQAGRRTWEEPKLEFVEPKLVKQGEMKQITAQGLVGTFDPGDDAEDPMDLYVLHDEVALELDDERPGRRRDLLDLLDDLSFVRASGPTALRSDLLLGPLQRRRVRRPCRRCTPVGGRCPPDYGGRRRCLCDRRRVAVPRAAWTSTRDGADRALVRGTSSAATPPILGVRRRQTPAPARTLWAPCCRGGDAARRESSHCRALRVREIDDDHWPDAGSAAGFFPTMRFCCARRRTGSTR